MNAKMRGEEKCKDTCLKTSEMEKEIEWEKKEVYNI
jgi:hypothetical protein